MHAFSSLFLVVTCLLALSPLWSCSSVQDQAATLTSADGGGILGSDSHGGTTDQESLGPAGNLAINELVTRAEGGGSDWVEFVVLGNDPVNLSDFTLVDDSDKHSPETLPDQVLQPGDFFVVLAISADDQSDAPSVPFKLGRSDALTLAKEGKTVDSIAWEEGAAPEGTSYGRLPDGTGAFQMLKPTPGAAND